MTDERRNMLGGVVRRVSFEEVAELVQVGGRDETRRAGPDVRRIMGEWRGRGLSIVVFEVLQMDSSEAGRRTGVSVVPIRTWLCQGMKKRTRLSSVCGMMTAVSLGK